VIAIDTVVPSAVISPTVVLITAPPLLTAETRRLEEIVVLSTVSLKRTRTVTLEIDPSRDLGRFDLDLVGDGTLQVSRRVAVGVGVEHALGEQAAWSYDRLDGARSCFVDQRQVADDGSIATLRGDLHRIVVALIAVDVLTEETRVGSGGAAEALTSFNDCHQAIDHWVPNECGIRGETISIENVLPIFVFPGRAVLFQCLAADHPAARSIGELNALGVLLNRGEASFCVVLRGP
jgi:hypothetical protein